MLRRSHILTTAALLAVCATPASAATFEDLQSNGSVDVAPPPSSIAASAADEYQDLRSPDAKDAARDATAGQDLRSPDAVDAAAHRGIYAPDESYVLNRDWGSPDADDAARDLPAAQIPVQAQPGPYSDAERAVVESPEVQSAVDRVSSEIRATPAVVEVEAPSGGFDWGDAGIGAAGMLGLFSIAAGFALLLTARRRRHGIEVAH
jgi:hypothetical protein